MTQRLSINGLERLRAALAARVERRELPGVVFLLARGNDVYADAVGTTAFDISDPMRRETPFRVASMTKPVVAAATMMLVDDGKLGLEDGVERWLPELANRRVLKAIDGPLDETVPARRPITVDDLLTNRLGFGQLIEGTPPPVMQAADDLELELGPPDPRTPHQLDQWISRFATLPLMYQPGERFLYNVGSLVLGALLARVADQPLGDLLDERIFQPLGMRRTGFSLSSALARQLPAYYMTNFETHQLERRNVSTPDVWSRLPAFPSGAGGLASTADDFLQFGRLLLDGGVYDGRRLLSERSVELMTTNQLTDEQIAGGGTILDGNGWGFGMGVITKPLPGRYGWAGGYGTAWFNDPRSGLVAIVLTQVSDFLWGGGLHEFQELAGAV
jgi:CubicO group peptidase (beta-lactamase class C family)